MSAEAVSSTSSLYSILGFNDKNKNGVIEKRSWRTLSFRDEGYKLEADLSGDGQINVIEAKFYLQNLPHIDRQTKTLFALTMDEKRSIFIIRLTKARAIPSQQDRFAAILSLANEMRGLGFPISEAGKIYEEAANIIKKASWFQSEDAIKISGVAVAMAENGQPRYMVMSMFKRAFSAVTDDLAMHSMFKQKYYLEVMTKALERIKRDINRVGLSENEREYVKRDFMAILEAQLAKDEQRPVPEIPVNTKSERYQSISAWLKGLSRLETSENIRAMIVDIYFAFKEGNMSEEEQKELVKEIFDTIGAIAKATLKIEAVDALLFGANISGMNRDERTKLYERGKETIDQVYETGFRFQGYLKLAVRMHQGEMARTKVRNMITQAEGVIIGEITYDSNIQIGETMVKCGFSKEEAKAYYLAAINSARANSSPNDENGSMKSALTIINVSMQSSGFTDQERAGIFGEAGVAVPE